MKAGNDSFMAKWRRFRNRAPQDRGLIVRAALILTLTKIGLRWFGFRGCRELIARYSLAGQASAALQMDVQREIAARAAGAVRCAELHGPVRANCLERSMTLWWMLRRANVAGELFIGARNKGAKFEAHAWVELDGQVLNDGEEVHDHYARFDAPIASAIPQPLAAVKTVPGAGKAAS